MRRSSAQTRAGHCAIVRRLGCSSRPKRLRISRRGYLQLSLFFHAAMSDIVSAEAAAQEGEALLPSAELAKNLGLTLAASIVLTFSTIVYMQGGLHSYFYAQSAYALAVGLVAREHAARGVNHSRGARRPHSCPQGTRGSIQLNPGVGV